MNKLFLAITFVFTLVFAGNAQQVPFYNHNLINPFIYNPAMTGHSSTIDVYFVRNQRYMGYGTGAINNYLTLDGDFFVPNMGFGLNLNLQSIGIQQQISAQAYFAYKIKLAENHNLRFGISGGYLDNRIDLSSVNVAQQDDPFLLGMQPNIAAFDFNAGLTYEWKDLRFGFAVPQLIGNKVKFSKENARGYYALARHFMGTLAYDFKFLESKELVLTPHALVRYIPGAPFQYDISAMLDYEKIGYFSATYKSDYAVQFNLGFHIFKSFQIGYSYEWIINTFKNNYSGMNHEFMVGYTFKRKKVARPNPKLEEENELLKKQVEKKDSTINDIEENKEEEIQRRVEEELKNKFAEYKKQRQDSLQKELDKMREDATQDKVEDPPVKDTVKKDPPPEDDSDMNDEKVMIARGYHFVELDGNDSPDGYYVISGVYSTQKNVDKQLADVKKYFPNARVVVNEKNTYKYVVVKQSGPKREAYNAIKKFRNSLPDERVWLLKYRKGG